MATMQVSERRARYTEALLFWAITLVICVGAGYGSYRYGRSWIGDRLGSDVKSVLTSDQLVNSVSSKALENTDSETEGDAVEVPPKEAVVEVKPVSLTSDDKAKLDSGKSGAASSAKEADKPADSDEAQSETPDTASDEAPAASRPTVERHSAPSDRKPRVAAESDEGGRFVVRAGSFKRRDNAERVAEQLRAKGYKPYLTTVLKDGDEYTRVNVGSYGDRDDALRVRGELRGEGFSDASVAGE